MNRSIPRRLTARNLLAAASLATLVACVVNLSFDMPQTVHLTAAQAGSISQTKLVDLNSYKDIQDHKSSVKSLSFDSADAVVTTVTSGSGAHVTGAVSLRKASDPADGSKDVAVGNLSNVAIVQGTAVHLPGSPALDAFLFAELQGDGRFYAVVSGNVDGPADFILTVTVHASIGYDAGL